MGYSIGYFNVRVRAEIESWPVDVVADYARIVELLIEHGPNVRLPHSRALGEGLSNSDREANRVSEERSTASSWASA